MHKGKDQTTVVMMYLVGNKQSLPSNVDPGTLFVTSAKPQDFRNGSDFIGKKRRYFLACLASMFIWLIQR
jgi:hypothetical protein